METVKERGLSGSTLKIIAVTTMLIDHTAATVVERYLDATGGIDYNAENIMQMYSGSLSVLYLVMRLIGRLGFPLFCFLLIEGFEHTKSVARYAIRLFIFALISEIPFDLAFSKKTFTGDYQNVFWTLLIGLLVLWGIDALKTHLRGRTAFILFVIGAILVPAALCGMLLTNLTYSLLVEFLGENRGITGRIANNAYMIWLILGCISAIGFAIFYTYYQRKKGNEALHTLCANMTIVSAAMFIAHLMNTDYAEFGVLTIAVMYAFRNNRAKEMVWGCIILIISSFIEITAFATLPLVKRYNGQRGLKLKIFFYAVYPVHLAILSLICYLVGLR